MRRTRFFMVAVALAAHAQTTGLTALPQESAAPSLPPGLYAVLRTSQGDITAHLFDKVTPHAVEMFVGVAQGTLAWKDPKSGAMVKRPLYDNITFHRVIRGEMIQSGDPTGSSGHDCGIHLPDEFFPGLQFNRSGKLAIANTGDPNSGSCQFFITDGPVPQWNGHYTIFGEVVMGQDVVSRISHASLHGEKPLDPVKLEHVTIERIAAAPKRPK
jgi:peptidyl-prolyl cis-trans isomerase A (cyclophilin A)